jgi:hypothetical protein
MGTDKNHPKSISYDLGWLKYVPIVLKDAGVHSTTHPGFS